MTDHTLPAALAATVAALGDSPAYSDKIGVSLRRGSGQATGWRTTSWNQLRDDTLDLAAGLIALGVEPGDRVAIMTSNRTEHVIADLAAVHAGAVPMSIYSTFSPRQIRFISSHAEPVVVVVEGADELERWSDALPGSSIRSVVVLESAARPEGDGYLGWPELLDIGRAFRAAHPDQCQARIDAIKPEDPVTILYTSGSTGDPKGVLISHTNMWFAAVGTGEAEIDVGPDSVSYLPYAHISERVLGMYIPQTSGGHVHQVSTTAGVEEVLREVRPMMFFGVPRVWEKLAASVATQVAAFSEADRAESERARAAGFAYVEAQQHGHRMTPEIKAAYSTADAQLRELRGLVGLDRVLWAGVGGAPMPPSVTLFMASLGIAVFDIYGMTETTASISSSGTGDFRLGSVGRPQEGNQVRVAEDGELLVKGPAVSAGYFRQEAASSALFDDDGWLRTGDIGRIDEDGFVFVTDRKKELIITSAGKNIAPSNVESLLKQHPVIDHALVFGDAQPYLVALLTLNPDAVVDHDVDSVVADAVAAANSELSRPEQVKNYVVLPRPWSPQTGELTATLKLRRRHLYAAYADEIARLYADPT